MSRWQFVDPLAVLTTYTFERNPNKVASINQVRKIDGLATGAFATPQIRALKPPDAPLDWMFSGTLNTKAMYDALVLWAGVKQIVHLIDDLARTFVILPTQFDPTDRPPTPQSPWRFSYDFHALLFETVPAGSAVTITTPTYTARG